MSRYTGVSQLQLRVSRYELCSPCVQVMNVCTQMLVFRRFRGPARSFLIQDVHTNDPGTSTGYPARKLSLIEAEKHTQNPEIPKNYAAPIGAFFCPEIRAFTDFGGEISSTVSKVLSDRKVQFKHKNGR